MSEKQDSTWWPQSKKCLYAIWGFATSPITIAVLLSIAVIYFFYLIGTTDECVLWFFYCTTPIDRFWKLSPNEMGDTLSGLAGAIILVWVVASTFMQRRELREQRREFQKMVDAQDAQVRALDEQAKILEQERTHRLQAETDRFIDMALSKIEHLVVGLPNHIRRTKVFVGDRMIEMDWRSPQVHSEDDDILLREIISDFIAKTRVIWSGLHPKIGLVLSSIEDEFKQALSLSMKILKNESEASPTVRERLEFIEFRRFCEVLEAVCDFHAKMEMPKSNASSPLA